MTTIGNARLRSALWMRHATRELAPVDPYADDADETVESRRSGDQHGGRTSHQSTGNRGRSEA